jgi:phytoene synthase
LSNAPLSAVGETARRHDRERFLAALFAPADRREALFALYAFNYEVAKTREIVSEPTLGRIRLEWWRETIDDVFGEGAPRRHYVAEPLAEAVRRHGLTRYHFDRLIDARENDIDGEPPATLAALESYVEDTAGRLVLLALEALGAAEAEAAGRHAGIAYGLAGLLRAIPFHAAQRRSYLPPELGVPSRELFAMRPTPALRQAAERLAELARDHLRRARALAVPRRALPALLPARLAEASLARLAARSYDPFAVPARASPFAGLRLGFGVWRGRL